MKAALIFIALFALVACATAQIGIRGGIGIGGLGVYGGIGLGHGHHRGFGYGGYGGYGYGRGIGFGGYGGFYG